MSARARMCQADPIRAFFNRVSAPIAQETALANTPGLRASARQAAADRAHQLSQDFAYLRASYSLDVVMVGQGSAQ